MVSRSGKCHTHITATHTMHPIRRSQVVDIQWFYDGRAILICMPIYQGWETIVEESRRILNNECDYSYLLHGSSRCCETFLSLAWAFTKVVNHFLIIHCC